MRKKRGSSKAAGGICQWTLLTEKSALWARHSLAQHAAEGGVLGKLENRFESLHG